MLLCYLGNHIHIPLGISELNKKEPFFLSLFLFLFFHKGILGCVGIKQNTISYDGDADADADSDSADDDDG